MKQGNYILWLPSWYPNKLQPFIGDFIQRHARAVMAYCPVTVFYFTQDGGPEILSVQQETVFRNYNLTEVIFYPGHKPLPSKFINQVTFNFRFYRQAKHRLLQHFKIHGLPLGVHVHVPMKAGILALWIKRKWNIPFILSEHSSAYVPQIPDYFFTRSFYYRRQVRAIFKTAAAVTNVSEFIGVVLKQIFNIDKIEVIRNVVDTDLFSYEKNIEPPPFKFLHVSTLDEVKNINGLLMAFSLIKKNEVPWQLILVGPVTERLKDSIAKNGLQQKVRLTGMISYEQVSDEMKSAHAFVLFSKMENFPCVIIEALCCGLPIVAGEVSGVPEAVDESNGVLVPNGDEAALAKALQSIMLHYKMFDRGAISAAAQSRFSFAVIGLQIFKLYQSVFLMAR